MDGITAPCPSSPSPSRDSYQRKGLKTSCALNIVFLAAIMLLRGFQWAGQRKADLQCSKWGTKVGQEYQQGNAFLFPQNFFKSSSPLYTGINTSWGFRTKDPQHISPCPNCQTIPLRQQAPLHCLTRSNLLLCRGNMSWVCPSQIPHISEIFLGGRKSLPGSSIMMLLSGWSQPVLLGRWLRCIFLIIFHLDSSS